MNTDNDHVWTPPDSPDPSAILNEAVNDSQSGQHELALAKHLWYHHHALEHSPAQHGVRLSFALGYWHELATEYPPAMVELRALRDCATQNASDGVDVHNAFQDARSINRVLEERASTRNLFLQLHKTDEDLARTVYQLAQPTLISFGDYDICNRYLDATTVIDGAIQLLHVARTRRSPVRDAKAHRDHIENHVRTKCATVIALLVTADRLDEAISIAERIRNEWNDPSLIEITDLALGGEFPPQPDW